MHWSADYIGLPYARQGRTRAGLDCWGLVRLAYLEHRGILLPLYEGGGVDDAERAEIAATLDRARAAAPWRRVAAAQAWDVAVFARARLSGHVGIVIGGGEMLHAHTLHGVVIESYARPPWSGRLIGIYRHEG